LSAANGTPTKSFHGWDENVGRFSMSQSILYRSQLAAVAALRWRMFVNGLRSSRARTELASRIIVTFAFAFGGLTGFVLATGFSWFFVSQGKTEFIAILLWPVFFFWQVFPVMATAFTNNPDSSDLLRFPLTYRSFFLIRLAYGFLDPASALGSVGLLGILFGITIARPLLFPWAFLVLFTFAIFNLVLMQTIFAWIERWLAQRRTREILGVVFILTMLSFQLVGPMMQRFDNRQRPELTQTFKVAGRIQGALPPGLAADAIARASKNDYVVGLTSLLFLSGLTTAVGYLLHMRLHRQFLGENLSEVAARPVISQMQEIQVGWELPGFTQTVGAVFEKEVRYLARSGPMLLTLIMPLFMLIVFRLGPMNPMRQANFMSRAPGMAFPGAAAYSLLVLTNLVYNSFGGDGGGIQFFYASPVSFRQIMLGKNLTHASILLANSTLALVAVTYFYGAPALPVSLATLAGLLFAAPLNFTAGNLLSIYAPKKRDFATFGRQNVAQTTVLASLGVQVVIVACGVGAFAVAHFYKNPWIAVVIFLALAAITISLYTTILRRMDQIAVERRETLLAELCRA
jgi:ABC-2 type transport system permease protein